MSLPSTFSRPAPSYLLYKHPQSVRVYASRGYADDTPPKRVKPTRSKPPAHIADTLETAALSVATAAHLAALYRTATVQQPVSTPKKENTAANLPTVYLTFPLLVAFIFARWSGKSSRAATRQPAGDGQSQHSAEELSAIRRQVDKLSGRVKLHREETKSTLAQVTTVTMKHEEVLGNLVEHATQLQTEVKDSQDLIAALQELASKQLALTMKIAQMKDNASKTSANLAALTTIPKSVEKVLENRVEKSEKAEVPVESNISDMVIEKTSSDENGTTKSSWKEPVVNYRRSSSSRN